MSKDQSSPNDRVPNVSSQGAAGHLAQAPINSPLGDPIRGPKAPRSHARGLNGIPNRARTVAQCHLWLLVLFAVLPACISETPAGTVFGSDPPGATLYVDGKESGYVTPCSLHLSEGSDHEVRLELPGYLPAEFELQKSLRVDLIGWGEGTTLSSGFTSPTYLPFFGLIAPIRTSRGLSPGRIFVRLQASDSRP